jgi:hypothetical protein
LLLRRASGTKSVCPPQASHNTQCSGPTILRPVPSH